MGCLSHEETKDEEAIDDVVAKLHAEACGTGCVWHTNPKVINRMYREKAIKQWRASP